MKLSTLDVLLNARNLLSSPTNWCKGARAIDGTARHCPPKAAHAAQWCLVGAIERFADDETRDKVFLEILTTIKALPEVPKEEDLDDYAFYEIATFNDRSSHALVLKVLDETIARGARSDNTIFFIIVVLMFLTTLSIAVLRVA